MIDQPLPPLAVMRFAAAPSNYYREWNDPLALRAATRQFFLDKGYLPEAFTGDTWTGLVTNFLLFKSRALPVSFEGAAKHQMVTPYVAGKAHDGWLRMARIGGHLRTSAFIGHEAAASARLDSLNSFGISKDIATIPIAIIGFGAAGIIAASSLADIGFTNLTIFEHLPEVAGIWSRPTVYEGTRNNPRQLSFSGHNLDAAPGDGNHVRRVLRGVATNVRARFVRELVTRVVPGNLDHQVWTRDGVKENFAIVINAIGLGNPRPISDPSRMIGPTAHVTAARWQDPRLKFERGGKPKVLLVGLGNSTAEMMALLQDSEIDYRVLTHYPRDAVMNPQDNVARGSKTFRVFRDLGKPDLTGFQGDLSRSHEAYYRALIEGKIISDVTAWDVHTRTSSDGPKKLGLRVGKSKMDDAWEFTNLYVLTGYQHATETYKKMGIPTRRGEGSVVPIYDYDGEFSAGTSPARGYFGFGAVLDAPGNRNAVVIPGMLYRLPELLFGVIARAGAWRVRLNTVSARIRQTILWQWPDQVAGLNVNVDLFPETHPRKHPVEAKIPNMERKIPQIAARKTGISRIRDERGRFSKAPY